jgi:hypothetical protein
MGREDDRSGMADVYNKMSLHQAQTVRFGESIKCIIGSSRTIVNWHSSRMADRLIAPYAPLTNPVCRLALAISA